jgi:hypothetical protein
MYAQDPELANLNALTSYLLLEDDDLIKNQNSFDVYDELSGWNGSLSNSGGISTLMMHKVKLGNQNILNLTGTEVDISSWKASINDGWNWLAYPLSRNIGINDALALLEAEEGDVIKNQTGFAIYDPFIGWSGTLSYMETGEGYMLRSSKDQEFSYPAIFKTKSGNNSGRNLKIAENSIAEVSGYSAYENNMNIVAEIVSEEDFDTVWVTDPEGRIRGKSVIVNLDSRRISYITVFGNAASDRNLLFELGTEESKTTTGVHVKFTPNAILGTVNNPVLLGMADRKTEVFPNPFSDKINIRIIAEKEQTKELILSNLVGNQVYQKAIELKAGENNFTVSPNIPAGVYFLKILMDDQKQVWKVIKR